MSAVTTGEPVISNRTLSGRRVLVAKDEYLLAEEVRMELVAAGAAVVGPVARLKDALDLITREAKLDAAILDINLRGEMVFPAADLLAERGVPFVFTTGNDVSIIPQRFENAAVCKKPTSMSAVISAVGRLVHA